MSTDQVLKCKETLDQLASNLWWSWQPQGAELWCRLDADQWSACQHSPRQLLTKLGDRLDTVLSSDEPLRDLVLGWGERMHSALNSEGLWHDQEGRPCEGGVVYFCSEYGLHESVATYSGGLGILAGDHVKSASDLGLPFIGVGLLYRRGYVQQRLSAQGDQHSEYLTFDFDSYPAKLAHNDQGEVIKVSAPLLDGQVAHCQVWELSVGRVSLYLLDADIDENPRAARLAPVEAAQERTHTLYLR